MKKSILALAAVIVLAPAAAMAQGSSPIRVGGDVKAPMRVRYVAPVYPEMAKNARVGGIVIAEAVVGTDGRVSNVQVLKSIPLLDQAAIDAISQWAYTPTTLNGTPVPVIMTVTVNFTPDATAKPSSPEMTQEMRVEMLRVQLAEAEARLAEMKGGTAANMSSGQAVRIGGDIKAPERVKYVPPVYPQEAQDAKVSGIVIIEALVDEQGFVSSAKVLKSIALLDQAARDAVLLWK
jgi:protein TonB